MWEERIMPLQICRYQLSLWSQAIFLASFTISISLYGPTKSLLGQFRSYRLHWYTCRKFRITFVSYFTKEVFYQFQIQSELEHSLITETPCKRPLTWKNKNLLLRGNITDYNLHIYYMWCVVLNGNCQCIGIDSVLLISPKTTVDNLRAINRILINM